MLLSDICEIIMGQSPSSDSYNVKGQGLPFFQGNADFGKLYPSVRLWCNCPIKKAEAGDLLVSVRAPIGAVNLANQKCCIGRGLAALRPYRDKCDAMYLYYLIKAGKNKLNWLGTGSTFKAITRSSLLSFNVPDYCIAFQRKISGKLWSVDKLIHQRNEQLKLFDLLIQSRFIEMFGDPQSNCYNWKIVPLKDVMVGGALNGYFTKPQNYDIEGNVGVICVSDVVNRKYTNVNALRRAFASEKDLQKYCVKYGDMLFCRSSLVKEGIGKASIIPPHTENDILFECHVIKITLDMSRVIPEYLQALSITDFFRIQVIRQSKTATMTTIGQKDIASVNILLPPMELQKRFTEFSAQIDKSKLAVQKSLDELEILKKSLMQQYFG